MSVRSIGGRSSNRIAGGTSRRGPANETGDARSDQTGSVRMLSPRHWSRKELWPTHVTARRSTRCSGGCAEGRIIGRDSASGATNVSSEDRVSIHLMSPPTPCGAEPGQGFRNPSSWRCESDNGSTWSRSRLRLSHTSCLNDSAACDEVLAEVIQRLHSNERRGDRKGAHEGDGALGIGLC